MFSGISKGNEVTESMLEDEGVQMIIEGYFEVGKKFRELEFFKERLRRKQMQG